MPLFPAFQYDQPFKEQTLLLMNISGAMNLIVEVSAGSKYYFMSAHKKRHAPSLMVMNTAPQPCLSQGYHGIEHFLSPTPIS